MTAPEATTMSGADLKVAMAGLGLPPSWLARQLGVAMRTVVRWFDDDEVGARVVDQIATVQDDTLAEMKAMIAEIPDGDETVVLKTYRTDKAMPGDMPAEWHRSLTFRVVEHLRAHGRDVRIEYA